MEPWPAAGRIEYKPLSASNAEIRVLKLQMDGAQLSCSPETVPPAPANPFYALSYVWGNADEQQTIRLNGKHILTRKNLSEFLRSLCIALKEPIRVWVDFLCINQHDLGERNSQVAMMGQIYMAADSVYAWLGGETLESERIFDFIHHAKDLRARGTPYREIYNSNPEALYALTDLIARPYWTRLWIIQDIVLAKRLWLFCGPRFIAWDDFLFALEGHRNYILPNRSRGDASDPVKLLRYLKESRETPTAQPLSKLVHRFNTAKCHDRRDKIFGMLALAHKNSKHLVVIDYGKPLLQILLETYPCWAADWILEQDDAHRSALGTHPYTVSLFCREFNSLFSEEDLLNVFDDLQVREKVEARVVLKGMWENQRCSFNKIAIIDRKRQRLVPTSSANSETLGVSEHTISVLSLGNGQQSFTFTTVTPSPNDRVLLLGPLILMVRRTSTDYSIIGRGISQSCLSNKQILDPHLWDGQLLPDSCFEIIPSRQASRNEHRPINSTKSDHICVRLNAAALVELLIATKEQELTWNPYAFGLESGLLKICRTCWLIMHSRRVSDNYNTCQCAWGHEAHPAPGYSLPKRRQAKSAQSPLPIAIISNRQWQLAEVIQWRSPISIGLGIAICYFDFRVYMSSLIDQDVTLNARRNCESDPVVAGTPAR